MSPSAVRSLEMVRHPAGWVEPELSGRALSAATEQGLTDFAVSMSHEAGYATAVVIARQG